MDSGIDNCLNYQLFDKPMDDVKSLPSMGSKMDIDDIDDAVFTSSKQNRKQN